MRTLALLFAVALALMLAGCGGDDDAADEPADTPPPAETEEPADGEAVEGRQVFITNCGGCHTLSDAGTTGAIGPPLEDRNLPQDRVEMQVRQGGGQMPAFEGTLSDEEIQAVAAYVAEQSGGG